MPETYSWPVTQPTPAGGTSTQATEIAPIAGVDFGWDVSCYPDLDETFTPITGPRLVAEAIYRRLCTPSGGMPFDENYGTDLRGWLNESGSAEDWAACGAAIESEALKDDRVESCTASVVYSMASQRLEAKIRFTTAAGPFRLVLGISKLTVDVLSAGTD